MKKFKKRWIVLFLIIFLVCIWVFGYIRGEAVSTQVAREETYEDKINVNAVFVRNENVYTTKNGGVLLERAGGDSKVAKGAYIATVYSNGIDDEIKQEIKEINQRINALKKVQNAVKTLSPDLNSSQIDIKNGIYDIASLSAKNDLTELDLQLLCLEEIMKSGSGSVVESTIEQLEKRREQIEQSLTSGGEKIYAEQTGIFIPAVDGYEDVLRVDNYESITLDVIDDCIKNAQNELSGGNTFYNAGDKICKVADNTEWMLACRLGKEETYGLKVGKSVKVRVPGEEEFCGEAEVIKLFSEDDENFICILRIGDYSKNIYLKRVAEVEIIKNSYTGLAIPAEALRFSDDNTSGVFVNSNGFARFRKVNVLHSDDIIAIVENEVRNGSIRMYDRVILNRDGIYDGKSIR